MAGDAAPREAGQFGIGDPHRVLDLIDQIAETGAKHDRDFRHAAAKPLDQRCHGIRHFRIFPSKPKGSKSPIVTVSTTPASSHR